VITHNLLNCCENKTLNNSTTWDNVMFKNVTVSYKLSQPNDFKIIQSNKLLQHISLIKTL